MIAVILLYIAQGLRVDSAGPAGSNVSKVEVLQAKPPDFAEGVPDQLRRSSAGASVARH